MVAISGPVTVNNGHAWRRAVLAGLGLVKLPDVKVAEDIAQTRLQLLPTAHALLSRPMHRSTRRTASANPSSRALSSLRWRRLAASRPQLEWLQSSGPKTSRAFRFCRTETDAPP